jgi:hypothetical protein
VNRSGIGGTLALIFLGLIAIAAGCWLRAIYAPEWLPTDSEHSILSTRPWTVEGDCYSQLARVQRILHGQGLIQNHFAVENWPQGLTPSTTAPFDYVILALYVPLTLFTSYPLDWAGALVSPALWLGLVLFWVFFRSREFNRIGRLLFVIGASTLPAFIWATACGRPRHQSLIMALMAIGLTAEYERWHVEMSPKRAWNIFAGIIWGFACWTSLFEPALVITLLVVFNFVVRRKESPAFLISFGAVMLVALILEGPHIYIPPAEFYEPLQRWLTGIAEVRGLTSYEFISQMLTLSFVTLVPLVAWRLLKQAGDHRVDLLMILLTVLLAVLAFVQKRWIYYANLTELFLIVRYCQIAPLRWTRLLVMAFILTGIFYDNIYQIEGRHSAPPNQPSAEMAKIADSIDGTGGIMGPWWLSPGLLYFSGQPIVSGTSHCGISGIVDSAKFFSATSWLEAEKILQLRHVRWVVVYDDPTVYNGYQQVYPLVNNSCHIVGLPGYEYENQEVKGTVGQILITDHLVPTTFQLRAVTSKFKLYEYLPEAGN